MRWRRPKRYESLLDRRPGVVGDLCVCRLVFFRQALAAARNSNAGRAALDHLRWADRGVAGHHRQPAGFCGGGLDLTSEITCLGWRLAGLTRVQPEARRRCAPGTVFAYNAGRFTALERPWTKHMFLK